MNSTRRRLIVAGSGWASAALCGGRVRAQTPFPNRAITLVDPATPGSSTDYFSRALAAELSRVLGQPVVVDNKPGAGGAIATEFVARARPDGYTLGLAAVSTHAANPALNKALRYDPVNDFAPITTIVTLPSAIVVRASSPIRSLDELVELARSKPGSVSFASPGVGTAGHVLLEMWSHLVGVKFLHVPYRGSGAILQDLLGGQLDVASDNIPAILPHIQNGSLRALAVRDTKRIAQLPDVKTLNELGHDSVSYPLWFGLVAPAGTSADIVNLLNNAAHKAMQTPAFQERVDKGAATYAPSTPEQFRVLIAEWLARFRKTVEVAKITLE